MSSTPGRLSRVSALLLSALVLAAPVAVSEEASDDGPRARLRPQRSASEPFERSARPAAGMLARFEAMKSSTVAASGRDRLDPATAPAFSIDGGLEFDGAVLVDGLPFLHNDGGPTAANTALGLDALANNSAGEATPSDEGYDGQFNTALGSAALYQNTAGSFNTATGAYALLQNDEGNYNTATGVGALGFNEEGHYNTAFGTGALTQNTSGSYNAASGAYALFYNYEASFNTAHGAFSLFYNVYGSYNTAIGAYALISNTTGISNTSVGDLSMGLNETGSSNTAIGAYALATNTIGSGNVAIGTRAGYEAIGSNNIFIANEGVPSDSGVIRIGGPDQTSTFIAGIHDATGSGGLQVFVHSDNQLAVATSSRRFKEGIEPMGEVSAALEALRPVIFRYKEEAVGSGPRPLEFGLIAEEVAEIYPELVTRDGEGKPYSVRYHALAPMLLNELQLLQAEVAALRHRNEELETLALRLRRLERLVDLGAPEPPPS